MEFEEMDGAVGQRWKKMAAFCLVISYRQIPSPTHVEFLRSD
jgi:hypothetical protein